MKSFLRTALISFLSAFTLQAQLRGQASAAATRPPAQPEAGTYQVAGIVLNANSGAPLDRIDVTITPAGKERNNAETTTGEDGSFVFNSLPAGKYRVVASRRGYVTSAYQEHQGFFFTGIVAGPGLDTTHLRFQIMPAAILSGTVTDDSGDPVPDASVTLFRQNSQSSQGYAMRVSSDSTDDAGAFEFARLEPGTYLISASAKPWYAFHPPQRPRLADGTQTEPELPRSPLDVAYPMTFYADTTDSGAATPIPLRAGDHPQISLTMHAVPAVRLRLQLPPRAVGSNERPLRGESFPSLAQTVFGTPESIQVGSVITEGPGGQRMLEIAGLAPGEYTLDFRGQDGHWQGTSAQIDLSSDRVLDGPPSSAGVDVNVALTMAFGARAPQDLNVSLAPVNGRRSASGKKVSEDGAFSFHDVAPGLYELLVTGGGRQLPVLHIRTAGRAIEGGRIQIGSDAVTLTADVAVGSAAMNGFVYRNGQGLGGAMVVLVPRNPVANPYLFRRDQSDSDGSFSLLGIVPGRYTLIAIDDGWELEWAREGALQKYLAQGKQIELKEGTDKIDLPEPIEVQEP